MKYSFDDKGPEATKAKWEKHWRSLLDESRMEWFVKEARGTSIRLPIGYFTLGVEWCRGTPFEPYANIYAGAWAVVREFVGLCRKWGVGVLLDFHAAYGGANKDEHSGSGSGKAELWTNPRNMDRTREALAWIAREVNTGLDGVIGIQVVNEAAWRTGNEKDKMYEWYSEVIRDIGTVDQTIPIYLSDAWDLTSCSNFINTGSPASRKLKDRPTNPIITDHHYYYTFDEKHRSCTPQEIISKVAGAASELHDKRGSVVDGKHADVIVGEWSCVLDGKTWGRVKPEEKPELVRQFGLAQSNRWATQTSGSYFWTWRMEWMDGGEWGFVQQVKQQNISAPPWLLLGFQDIESRSQQANGATKEKLAQSKGEHEGYWNKTSPKKKFHHELYEHGFATGWNDGKAFFGARMQGAMGGLREGGDKIGVFESWVGKRLREAQSQVGFGEFAWEWEQGFRKGVKEFENVVGI